MTNRARVIRVVCERLTEEVAQLAPPGLGDWDGAWEIVDAPSAVFLECLTRWEQTGEQTDQDRCDTAYAVVIDAWRLAASEFEALPR